MHLRLAVRSALAVGAAAVVLAGCSFSLTGDTAAHHELPTTAPAAVHRSDFAAIRELMHKRARAVVQGNERAFMSTVDTADPDFVAAQKVMYDNLAALPVTAMSYEIGSSGLPPASGITGGPVLSPEVIEHVFFAGTDRRPVANGVSATFVKRSGGWLLAADATDPNGPNGDTARPWAGPPIAVAKRGPLIVVADPRLPGGVQALAETVLSDLRFDAGVLDVPVDDHLLVDATTSGSPDEFDNKEAAGATTFSVVASRNFHVVAAAGMRVKINPHAIQYLNQNPTLLRHELVHYLTRRYSPVNPKWLTEGLAEYVSHQPAGLPSEYMSTQTYDRLMKRPRELTVSGLFGQDPTTDYPLAMACVTYLVQQGGMDKLKELMRTYASYPFAPFQDSHTDEALRKVYGLTGDQVAQGAFTLLAALR